MDAVVDLGQGRFSLAGSQAARLRSLSMQDIHLELQPGLGTQSQSNRATETLRARQSGSTDATTKLRLLSFPRLLLPFPSE